MRQLWETLWEKFSHLPLDECCRWSSTPINVEFDDFGRANVIACAERRAVTVDELLSQAGLYGLSARESGRVSWQVPDFRRHACPGNRGRSNTLDGLRVVLKLAGEDWRALEAESSRQAVTVERLLQQAALYLLADLDASGVR